MEDRLNLGPDIEAALGDLIESGRYPTREDVLREGVRLVQGREARLAAVEAAVISGIEDAEAGRSEDAEIVFARMRAKYEASAAKAAA